MAMPATVASTKAPKAHLDSFGSRLDMAALRSPAGRISAGSVFTSAGPGPVKAPMRRALQVWGLLLPFPAVGDMTTSGYRRQWGSPNHPTAAGGRVLAGYGYGPA